MIADFSTIHFQKLQRINIIGTAGVGKTTVAKKISTLLQYPHLEMDQLFWGKNWKKPTNKEFYDRLKKQLEENSEFILDGNYTKATTLKWAHTQTVIWINLSFGRTLWQLISRTFYRVCTQVELWPQTENTESFYRHLCTTDSIFYWFAKTFNGNKIKYRLDMHSEKWQHIQFIELTTNCELNRFIKLLEQNLNQIKTKN